jgi:hypothetical protein
VKNGWKQLRIPKIVIPIVDRKCVRMIIIIMVIIIIIIIRRSNAQYKIRLATFYEKFTSGHILSKYGSTDVVSLVATRPAISTESYARCPLVLAWSSAVAGKVTRFVAVVTTD